MGNITRDDVWNEFVSKPNIKAEYKSFFPVSFEIRIIDNHLFFNRFQTVIA